MHAHLHAHPRSPPPFLRPAGLLQAPPQLVSIPGGRAPLRGQSPSSSPFPTPLPPPPGPNASGKSCYARAVALIAYLAHLGSYVPAQAATIGLADRIAARCATPPLGAATVFKVAGGAAAAAAAGSGEGGAYGGVAAAGGGGLGGGGGGRLLRPSTFMADLTQVSCVWTAQTIGRRG